VSEARAAWRAERMPMLDPEKSVFVDETWASTAMTRRRGRAPRGTKLVSPVPHSHWMTTTFVAALSATGLLAPMVTNGAMTGALFEAWLEQGLLPTLAPGTTVIMDNLASHKRARVRELIAAAGCRLLYLPPYSPDLNPIELTFSKLKALLRSAGKRTVDDLHRFLGEAMDEFSPASCRATIEHVGYGMPATPK
jgi:transposase